MLKHMLYVLYSVLGVIIIAAAMAKKYSLDRMISAPVTPNEGSQYSALLSYYSAGHSIIGAGRHQIDGMHYSMYLTTPPAQASSFTYVNETALIFDLELPFNTETHMIGLSKQHKTVNRLQLASFLKANGMEAVTLEGNFSDSFEIYASVGQQFQARVVLDPAAMAYVADYCQSHFWEISGAELYIVATSADTTNTDIVTESKEFAAQIKPALLPGTPGAAVVHHDLPYGGYDGPVLSCPICHKTMTKLDDWQSCVDGHGLLVSGRTLAMAHRKDIKLPASSQPSAQHGALQCPNCKNMMLAIGYNGIQVEIDSCEHCMFRWIDSGEIAAIAAK